MVNLGAVLEIKAVLIIAIDGFNYEYLGWIITLGNSADPTANSTIFTAGSVDSVDWAKEVLVDSSGQYVAILSGPG